MGNSTKPAKPEKPYPDFPLFPHANGHWAKKIRGKLHYFGKWTNPQSALDRYLAEKEYLHAGRTPPSDPDGLTIKDLCNQFLTSKRHLLDTREIVERTFRDYLATCQLLIKQFGKNHLVDDLDARGFELLRKAIAKNRGPVAIGNEVGRVRSVFKYGYESGLIEKPIRYGQGFKKPSAKTLRKARAENGCRMFEANEIRAILQAASQPLKCMVFLGINCGYGQSDIASLSLSAANKALETRWLDFPRPKTGVERRCPLWLETIDMLQEVIDTRPKPKDRDDDKLVFITKYGCRWVKPTGDDAVAKEFSKRLRELGLKRPRLNFYALRHTFETIVGGSRDQVAVNFIMGHIDNSMSGVYRERISDERLIRVVNVVHDWLFGK